MYISLMKNLKINAEIISNIMLIIVNMLHDYIINIVRQRTININIINIIKNKPKATRPFL